MENHNRKIIILYGSQTGTAQELAERIWREAQCNNFEGPVLSMDEYPVTQLISEELVVFVCSTTGQGDQPDNMKHFWKFLLKRSLPIDSLKYLRFAVLGLGNSSYVKFNFVAKKLHRRLLSLGGQALCNVGLADDQHDLGADAVIDPWILNLWDKLDSVFPLSQGSPAHNKPVFPLPRWHVQISEDSMSFCDQHSLDWMDKTSLVEVTSNKRVTDHRHFQDVRLIKLKSELPYIPGDILMVRPQNSSESVEKLLDILKDHTTLSSCKEGAIMRVLQTSKYMPVPHALYAPITLQQCAKHYWDLNAVPRRYCFQIMAHFTSSDLEREKLEELTSSDGQEELYKYCNRPRRSILEVLSDFPHVAATIPVPYLFDMFQPIRQRAFSIASSHKAHPEEIHILVAVVQYKTSLFKPRLGLCSNWLALRSPKDHLAVSVETGSFKFPERKDVPLIMVGPGTGVAPFRSLIQERCAAGQSDTQDLLLVFGNRNRATDFHFSDEWEFFQKSNRLTVFTAFSRDQPHKIYVQHIIQEQSQVISSWLEKGSYIFVAGNAKNMPTAVRSAFIKVIEKAGDYDSAEAEKIIGMMESKGMYQTETWS